MSCLKFRLKEIDKTGNYLLEEIKHNDLMIGKYNQKCRYLNHSVCVSISAFASLVCVHIGITNSAVEIKRCAPGIRKYDSIIKKKKKKKHDETMFLGKAKLNTIEILISKALISSYISHDDFAPVNNELREYNEMKEEVKTSV